MKGLSLIELLVVIGVLIILAAVAIPAVYNFQKESDLNDNTRGIINTLKLARSKTLGSEGASQWGVYFTTSTIPHQYILFKGASYYSPRSTSSDEVFKLSKTTEFSKIDLAGEKEVVFNRLTGETYQAGKIFLRLKETPAKLRIIYIKDSGLVGLSTSSISNEE